MVLISELKMCFDYKRYLLSDNVYFSHLRESKSSSIAPHCLVLLCQTPEIGWLWHHIIIFFVHGHSSVYSLMQKQKGVTCWCCWALWRFGRGWHNAPQPWINLNEIIVHLTHNRIPSFLLQQVSPLKNLLWFIPHHNWNSKSATASI